MILVAGIGNIFLGDDAFGCEVATQLVTHPLPESVRVMDFGIRGLDLAYELLKPYDAVIIVDAASGAEAPGTLYVIDPCTGDFAESQPGLGAHELNPMRVLELAHQMGADLKNVRIVGCQPESLGEPEEGRIGLSDCVIASVGEAVNIIESLVRETLERKS